MKFLSIHSILLLLVSLLVINGCERMDITEPGNLVPLTVDEDPSLPAIEINGTRLFSYALGDANNPLVIILHGGPGGDHMALKQFEVLADSGYRVVFWDQRSAGLSRRHNPDVLTDEVYLEDLVNLIAYYQSAPEQSVFLLGHSWGAMYATMFINSYPDAVDGVILSEPGGFIEEDVISYISRTQQIEYTSEWSNDLVWMEQMMSPSKKWFSDEDHELFDYQYLLGSGVVLKESMGDVEDFEYPVNRLGAVVGYALPRSAPNFDWTQNLDQFNTKALFFYSELNPGYPEAHMNKVTSAYDDIEIHRINGVGHELMVTGFDQVLPIIMTYLRQR